MSKQMSIEEFQDKLFGDRLDDALDMLETFKVENPQGVLRAVLTTIVDNNIVMQLEHQVRELEDDIADLRDEADDLQKEADDLRIENDGLEDEISSLRSRN